ncbi:succinyl-diaminopimelate desuccinylase [Natronincola peptidivorans]|uniref:Succinyl-diaminopimelate desuccinylase n=2 Tax=Natronincola peptidivorans TaxID=426128 RepID=A0A1I0BT50_9FIRM|nr:succinyl-diaminopimelate desuccinylase [Natronincola peptidivorans]
MFNGHLDTVPPDNMKIPPLAAEVKDGYIWGRGTVDMKGAVACILMSMLALKRAKIVPDGDIIFTGVIGEEGKSEGTEHIVKLDLKTDAAIVAEPTNYEYVVGHRGLEWFDIFVKGRAAHSGTPERGVNAIEKAMVFMQKVKEVLYPKLKERHNEFMGESLMNFGTIQGGTGQSTVADCCIIRIDRRYVPGETVETVMQEYQDIIDLLKKEDPTFDAKIRRTPESVLRLNHPPLITSMNEPIVSVVRESLKEVIKKEPHLTTGFGWTDAALLSTYLKIPTVVVGPGDLSLAHTEAERIAIEDLVNTVEIYSRIIDKFCIKDRIIE